MLVEGGHDHLEQSFILGDTHRAIDGEHELLDFILKVNGHFSCAAVSKTAADACKGGNRKQNTDPLFHNGEIVEKYSAAAVVKSLFWVCKIHLCHGMTRLNSFGS